MKVRENNNPHAVMREPAEFMWPVVEQQGKDGMAITACDHNDGGLLQVSYICSA